MVLENEMTVEKMVVDKMLFDGKDGHPIFCPFSN